MSPKQKKVVEDYHVGQGVVGGGKTAQYGGYLGILASIGVPIAINLIRKMLGKGLQVRPASRANTAFITTFQKWKRAAHKPSAFLRLLG